MAYLVASGMVLTGEREASWRFAEDDPETATTRNSRSAQSSLASCSSGLPESARPGWSWRSRAPNTLSDRPYPSTADLYELELYLSLHRCTGLPRGTFHYDPREHALTMINDSESELTELLDSAKVAAGNTEYAQR